MLTCQAAIFTSSNIACDVTSSSAHKCHFRDVDHSHCSMMAVFVNYNVTIKNNRVVSNAWAEKRRQRTSDLNKYSNPVFICKKQRFILFIFLLLSYLFAVVQVTGSAVPPHQGRFKAQILSKNEPRNYDVKIFIFFWHEKHHRESDSTSISLMMSLGPIISESYFTCALLVAKATEA